MNHSSINYTINQHINHQEMRLIDDRGSQIGIFTKTDALKKAQQENKDLILITDKTNPPIVKLISFSKFLYQEKKKMKAAKKGIKKSIIKDIKLSLFISQHDLNRMIKKTMEFLKHGHQVRLNLPLKGRELSKKQMALDLIKKVISEIPNAHLPFPPKFQGKSFIAILTKK